jgi:hypothetical protein
VACGCGGIEGRCSSLAASELHIGWVEVEARPVEMDREEEEVGRHQLMKMDPVPNPYFVLFLSPYVSVEGDESCEYDYRTKDGCAMERGSRWDEKSRESEGKREGGSEWEEREREM